MLNQAGDLAVAELVFWVPATVLAVLVCVRHGFSRQNGWFLLILLGLARIIGASCTIAQDQLSTINTSLVEAAAITNSIGLSFLIAILIGLLSRVASGINLAIVPARGLRLLQLVILVGIILGIVGGVDFAGSDKSTGKTLLEVSIILFAVALVVVTVGLIVVTLNLKLVHSGERRLVLACWLSIPFVYVRLIYSLIDVFAEDATFNYYDPSIWARAFMATLPEFVVAIIVLVFGFLTKPIPAGGFQQQDQPYDLGREGQPQFNKPYPEYGSV